MRDDGELVAPKTMETLDELITTKRAEFYPQGRPLGERIPAEALTGWPTVLVPIG